MVVSNILINIIGYSGAVVGTLFMLPQVVKSVWSKKVNDVSLLTVIGFVVNCALWLTYGLLIHACFNKQCNCPHHWTCTALCKNKIFLSLHDEKKHQVHYLR